MPPFCLQEQAKKTGVKSLNEVIAYTNRLAVSSITPIMAPPINHFGRQQSCTDHEQYDKVLAYIDEPRRQPFDPVDLTNEDVNESCYSVCLVCLLILRALFAVQSELPTHFCASVVHLDVRQVNN